LLSLLSFVAVGGGLVLGNKSSFLLRVPVDVHEEKLLLCLVDQSKLHSLLPVLPYRVC
jgi:hypothetical protein